MNNVKVKNITFLITLLITLQIALFTIKKFIFLFYPRTDFSDSMSSMIGMLILSIIFIIFSNKKNISLSIFPKDFSRSYIFITILALVLFILTPSNYSDSIEPILLLFFSSIVTPVFEELIFRGYIWNSINNLFKNEISTYLITTILFALWHIGYISSIAFRVHSNLLDAIFWKVITGLCFGIVLGLVRLKTKNTYSTIILHGIMNIFGR